MREAQSKPLLAKIKAGLDEKASRVLPKGLLCGAITYTLGLWPLLSAFLEDGHIEMDNKRAENAIRPFVAGRNNWLFSGSPRGAQASATLYSDRIGQGQRPGVACLPLLPLRAAA